MGTIGENGKEDRDVRQPLHFIVTCLEEKDRPMRGSQIKSIAGHEAPVHSSDRKSSIPVSHLLSLTSLVSVCRLLL